MSTIRQDGFMNLLEYIFFLSHPETISGYLLPGLRIGVELISTLLGKVLLGYEHN